MIITLIPQKNKQTLRRSWLTPTISTSEAAKPANFKAPKQPVPKTSAEMTENTTANNETSILFFFFFIGRTSSSTPSQPPSPPQSKKPRKDE
ncbi:hypothetical protein GWI33_001205 [Rhynchophorus ferrugineus]|uniref:Uncharacterized protein n=1 Tax=Rhynchophorus ferrugineus TaxID=354439 RepID=A0A834MI47_RHYFE|nr:hypothetical protein GWI33_001205 [Rhynchophorus ferrugineus]